MSLALFASCGRIPMSEVRLIVEPEPELYPSMRNVMTCINEAAGTELLVMGVGVNAVRVIQMHDGDPDICGSWRPEDDQIWIEPDQGRRDCPRGIVEVHEVGHAMGLQHNYFDRSDIMFPTVTFLSMTQACRSLVSHFDPEE